MVTLEAVKNGLVTNKVRTVTSDRFIILSYKMDGKMERESKSKRQVESGF